MQRAPGLDSATNARHCYETTTMYAVGPTSNGSEVIEGHCINNDS